VRLHHCQSQLYNTSDILYEVGWQKIAVDRPRLEKVANARESIRRYIEVGNTEGELPALNMFSPVGLAVAL
jgi:hypothetical protein